MNKELVLEKEIACRVRKIRERYILIGAKKYFELNSIGKQIWDLIDGEINIEGIINELQREYDVEPEVLEKDIFCFLDSLLEEGALNVVE